MKSLLIVDCVSEDPRRTEPQSNSRAPHCGTAFLDEPHAGATRSGHQCPDRVKRFTGAPTTGRSSSATLAG
jgi:hypothetical protein